MVITIGGSVAYASSRLQQARALSSGEAEYYAATQGAADALHIAEDMRFTGVDMATPAVRSDSTACFGMASRRGVGRVRHLETRALWLQDMVNEKRIVLEKCSTEDNVADIGTKALEADRHLKLTKLLNMYSIDDKQIYNQNEGKISLVSGDNGHTIYMALGLLFQALGTKASHGEVW